MKNREGEEGTLEKDKEIAKDGGRSIRRDKLRERECMREGQREKERGRETQREREKRKR